MPIAGRSTVGAVAVGQEDWALADVDDGHARFKCSAECGEADDSWRRDGPTSRAE
jgi:hypothetical protein